MCLLMTSKILLSSFELEVHVELSGILNCPKGEKVGCNLRGEKQVQNRHSFSAIFMFILQKENLPVFACIHSHDRDESCPEKLDQIFQLARRQAFHHNVFHSAQM